VNENFEYFFLQLLYIFFAYSTTFAKKQSLLKVQLSDNNLLSQSQWRQGNLPVIPRGKTNATEITRKDAFIF